MAISILIYLLRRASGRRTRLSMKSGQEAGTHRFNRVALALLLAGVIALCGCEQSITHDANSLLFPKFHRSEIFGIVAGFGTTFAAFPDLLSMFRRRSSAGMNPRMVTIMGCFQILWVYYGVLIVSRPVVVWNMIAVLINSVTVGAYFYFVKREKSRAQ